MSRLEQLKSARSLTGLATLLGFRPSGVSFILYKIPSAQKYTTFDIPKRSGGHRTIKAPIDRLKVLQSNLSDVLQDCMDEIEVARKRKDRAVHGFKRDRSIISNANRHRHRRWVFNLDLEDFFPSINFGRVRGFLIKNRDFQLDPTVATAIAQIACHDNTLPQGSPCSPVISNLIAHILDVYLLKLASQAGCTYSRYADDLTFSTSKREFPTEIAVRSETADGATPHDWLPSKTLVGLITRCGFRVNPKKTHMMYRNSRQQVTGLVVNQRISVRSEYHHTVRAMVHSLTRTGSFEVLGMSATDSGPVISTRPGNRNELQGMLGFIDTLERDHKKRAGRAGGLSGRVKVYREFLMYTNFYAATLPVIICEGETDNIYLTHAIRSLSAEFPELAGIVKKQIILNVRLYKHAHRRTAELLGLRGGGDGLLSKFIPAYRKESGKFDGPPPTRPVIVLYDNDSGKKAIRSAIKDVTGRRPEDADPFVHIATNMYAVHTPGANSAIEDCFDDATKAITLDGKTFNRKNGIDTDVNYGKVLFAKNVVQPRADTIDFGGFRPLLRNLVAAINAYQP